jgi:gas vesicle protein
MGQNSEELTTTPADIAATRENLSRDIDELTDKVNPARVVDRRKEAARSRFGSVKERVMGAVPSPSLSSSGGSGGGIGSSVSSAKDSVSGSASGALGTVESKAQGNPLAAGLIAFGAGMLISALIPASEKEAQAAQRAVEAAKEHGQPLVDEAKSVGQQMGQDLKESATQSAQEVKASAQDSVENVKQEGQSSAQNVKNEATPSS